MLAWALPYLPPATRNLLPPHLSANIPLSQHPSQPTSLSVNIPLSQHPSQPTSLSATIPQPTSLSANIPLSHHPSQPTSLSATIPLSHHPSQPPSLSSTLSAQIIDRLRTADQVVPSTSDITSGTELSVPASEAKPRCMRTACALHAPLDPAWHPHVHVQSLVDTPSPRHTLLPAGPRDPFDSRAARS